MDTDPEPPPDPRAAIATAESRRRLLQFAHVTAWYLYGDAAYESGGSENPMSVAHASNNGGQWTFCVTMEASTFWAIYNRLENERGWR